MKPRPRRMSGWTRAVVIATTLTLGLAAWVALTPFPLDTLEHPTHTSTRILDRDGRLLREVLSAEDTRGRWATLDQIADVLELSTIHAEDRRFHDHAGTDFLAIARSIWIDLAAGEARTGASTITQQLVKLTVQRGEPRTIGTKLMEVVWAWRLELAIDKARILEEYLNRIPYGNQLIGIEAASQGYFGKPAATLSLAEAAYLAGLPSSPTRLNPYRFPERARARQRWLLDLMHERGAIDELAWKTALAQPLTVVPRGGPHLAPHLTAFIATDLRRPESARPPTIQTTISPELQRRLEEVLAQHRPAQDRAASPHALQAAAIVLDTTTSEVLAWVGSRDFSDRRDLGENDGVRAFRQPGSALKPFIYGLWLDRGGDTDQLLDDSPRAFWTPTGPYRPENYDRLFRGPVSPRTALASSLNIPAIDLLERLGVPSFIEHLRALGISGLDRPADHYGLGLALGNAEVRLVDLAGAYATLGRLGLHRPVTWLANAIPQAERVLSARSAYTILDMLADDRARGVGFGLAGPFELPYRVAAKTGTSSDFRDNWAFVVTPRHTVGVWVGHFQGTPMGQSPGRFGAAPLAREVLHTLYPHASRRGDVPWFTPPEGCPGCAPPEDLARPDATPR